MNQYLPPRRPSFFSFDFWDRESRLALTLSALWLILGLKTGHYRWRSALGYTAALLLLFFLWAYIGDLRERRTIRSQHNLTPEESRDLGY